MKMQSKKMSIYKTPQQRWYNKRCQLLLFHKFSSERNDNARFSSQFFATISFSPTVTRFYREKTLLNSIFSKIARFQILCMHAYTSVNFHREKTRSGGFPTDTYTRTPRLSQRNWRVPKLSYRRRHNGIFKIPRTQTHICGYGYVYTIKEKKKKEKHTRRAMRFVISLRNCCVRDGEICTNCTQIISGVVNTTV